MTTMPGSKPILMGTSFHSRGPLRISISMSGTLRNLRRMKSSVGILKKKMMKKALRILQAPATLTHIKANTKRKTKEENRNIIKRKRRNMRKKRKKIRKRKPTKIKMK